jgi:hypothetical protein
MAILPFFSSSMNFPPSERMQPFRVFPLLAALSEFVVPALDLSVLVVVCVVVWAPVVLCDPMVSVVVLGLVVCVPLLGLCVPLVLPYPP